MKSFPWAVAGVCVFASVALRAEDEHKGDHKSEPASSLVTFFADGQAQFAAGGRGNGFVLNDGAFYFSRKFNSGEALIDLPFAEWMNAGAVIGDGGKLQAWAGNRYSNGLGWRFGKFDSLFGFESNDSRDLFFTSQGLLYAQVPVTHLGLMPMFQLNDTFSFHALITNHSDRIALAGETPDLGVKAVLNFGSSNASVAFLKHDKDVAGEDFLLDLVAGTTVSGFALNTQFDYKKTTATNGWGGMLHGVYSLTDAWGLGLRGEYVSKMSVHQGLRATLGMQYAFTPELKAKLDYTYGSDTAVDGAAAAKTYAGALSAIYSF